MNSVYLVQRTFDLRWEAVPDGKTAAILRPVPGNTEPASVATWASHDEAATELAGWGFVVSGSVGDYCGGGGCGGIDGGCMGCARAEIARWHATADALAPVVTERNNLRADLDRATRTIDRLTEQSERISAELADAKRGEAALRDALRNVLTAYESLLRSDYETHENPDPPSRDAACIAGRNLLAGNLPEASLVPR